MKFWYFTEGNKADSSYTDFTSMNNEPVSSYTDFTGYGSSYANRNSESFRSGYNDYAGFGGSSYNDFAAAASGSGYTDFTVAAPAQPAWNRTVRKAKVRNFKGSGKKSGAGKVLACSFTVIAVLLAGALGAKYYMADDNSDGGNFFQNLFVNSGSKDPNNKAGAKVIPLGHEDFPENTTKSKEVSKEEENSETKTVYDIADNILADLQCDNDVDTARAIFNWVHSHIYYQTVHGNPTYEEAAYMGFTRKTGDCYVYFSCAKMLLDRARIPNLMVKRYPVVKNGHYWNLVQLNGEWYHCDATVFKDHPDLYFMLTDEEIADSHHEFDSSLYPARASRSNYNQDFYSGDVYSGDDYSGDDYSGDVYDFPIGPAGDPNSDDFSDGWNEPYEDVYIDD